MPEPTLLTTLGDAWCRLCMHRQRGRSTDIITAAFAAASIPCCGNKVWRPNADIVFNSL